MLCYIVSWNSDVVCASVSHLVYKMLEICERVNISITLAQRERSRLYRFEAVNGDMYTYLCETAKSLVYQEPTKSIFL
jgi:uncharacterized protein YsxB (DUF464 family)